MKWPAKKKQPVNKYIRYSNMGIQMMVMMALGVWLGLKLDSWIITGFPVFTLLLSFIGVCGAIWLVIKNLY